MTDPAHWLPLTPANVRVALDRIQPYIHRTPVLTSRSIDRIASTPQRPDALVGSPFDGQTPAAPRLRLFFKCENFQRIGAFKVRGAFHALLRLRDERGEDELRRCGVITHSSGNHAQALALAGATLGVPVTVVMPLISMPTKIAATRDLGATLVFSGATSTEREAVVAQVQAETEAFLIPPYDHADIILGQGTAGLELAEQHAALVNSAPNEPRPLNAVITPLGGGGLTAGVATWFSDQAGIQVFGAEPSFEEADDARRGLAAGARVETVCSRTIADGLRTPVGLTNWAVISDPARLAGVYSVTEAQIAAALRLVLERLKVVTEPSAAVGLAVCLFNEEFRQRAEREGGAAGWDVGIILSGGNTSVDALARLFVEAT